MQPEPLWGWGFANFLFKHLPDDSKAQPGLRTTASPESIQPITNYPAS